MKICREEIFGPVVVISKFKDDDGEQLLASFLAVANE